jgi:nucleoside-diphosphate-sugar epimerase
MVEPGDLALVSGANGFVGSHLVDALLARGCRVRCLVRRTSDLSFIRHLPVEWVYVDLGRCSAEELERACTGVDAIYHCAALTRALDQETFYRVNARGTQALARCGMEANPDLKRFLYVSSLAAAGPSAGPDDLLDESRPPRPVTWYGKSKWAAEQALLDVADWLPVTIVRPAPVFGPRERDFYAYFRLVKWGLNLQLGRRDRWMSLVYVHDLTRLILMAADSEKTLGQTYFGCGRGVTYAQLSQAIAEAQDKPTVRINLPEALLTPMSLWGRFQGRLTGQPALLNDQRVIDMRQRYWLCSGAKARQDLGFSPEYDLETAIRETASWYREHGWL